MFSPQKVLQVLWGAAALQLAAAAAPAASSAAATPAVLAAAQPEDLAALQLVAAAAPLERAAKTLLRVERRPYASTIATKSMGPFRPRRSPG